MTSKEKILTAIRWAQMDRVNAPEMPAFDQGEINIVEQFSRVVEAVSAKVYSIEHFEEKNKLVSLLFPEAERIASTVDDISGNYDLNAVENPVDLKSVDVAVILGQLGVAENGAIWVTETECVHRVLPFITQHLILVLDKKSIVANMHEAYQRIEIDETGFGVFIAGPSKTADIEQSLVIGAQGARSLTVIIV